MKKAFIYNEEKIEVEILDINEYQVKFKFDGEVYNVANLGDVYQVGEEYFKVKTCDETITVNGRTLELKAQKTERSSAQKAHKGDMLSPMPGKILKLNIDIGQSFKVGDPLVVMEAMKMEHTIKASVDGVLTKYLINVGQVIQGGIHLFEYKKA